MFSRCTRSGKHSKWHCRFDEKVSATANAINNNKWMVRLRSFRQVTGLHGACVGCPTGNWNTRVNRATTINIRRTNRRLTIFHKAINGQLALPIGHLQSVLRRTRHLNSKSYNTIHTSKDCYKYAFFPRTIKYWNSLPDKLATIKEPHTFKLALTHFD